MIRGFFRIVTLLLVGAFCFALGVYTGPTEPVVQLRAALEEKIASALQSLRVQTDKANLPAKEATRPPQPAPAASSAPESSAAAPAPAEFETGGMGAQAPAHAAGANPGTAESGESPSNAPSAPKPPSPPPPLLLPQSLFLRRTRRPPLKRQSPPRRNRNRNPSCRIENPLAICRQSHPNVVVKMSPVDKARAERWAG